MEFKNMSFRLLEYIDSNISVKFYSENKNIKCSLIIGNNGAGKSTVLFSIADFFDKAYKYVIQSPGKPFYNWIQQGFHKNYVKYLLNNQEVIVTFFDKFIFIFVDGEPVEPSLEFLPTKVLAFAHLPTDRYPFQRGNVEGAYRYLGLRQTTNMMSTSALVIKIMKSVWRGSQDKDKAKLIAKTLKQIGLEGTTEARFKVRDGALLFSYSLEDFRAELYKSLERKNSNSSNLNYKNDNVITYAYEFLKASELNSGAGGRFDGELSFALVRQERAEELLEGMEFLREMKLISNPEVSFGNLKGKPFIKFSDLSSGDQQILGTQIRLAAEIDENSLILIDEPEVSLHPRRQQKYIPDLYSNVPFINTCCVVMATHSHLMASNLPDGSSVVVAKEGISSDRREFKAMYLDPKGLPSEQILYSVFGIDASTSYYALQDVKKIIHLSGMQRRGVKLSNAEIEEVKEIKNRLSLLGADDIPLIVEVMPLINDVINNA